MKPNHYCRVIASILIVVIAAFLPLDAHSQNPEAAASTPEWVVPVFLPDIVAIPELYTDSWIDLADLPSSDRPESSFQGFRLPHINAIYTWHKDVIETLTANCFIIIDYKEATSKDLSALPFETIVAIGICGPQARVVTTSALTPSDNPALIATDLMEFVAMAKAARYDKK